MVIDVNNTVNKSKLAPTVRELLQDRIGGLPIWIRSPKTGTEFYTGLSRPKLYALTSAGKIKSVSIREPGQVKGTRLFLLASILAFIESCQVETEEKGEVENA